jgi:hypothetical protein
VVLKPNIIKGTIRFTNTNPEILAILRTEGVDGITAHAQSPVGYYANIGYMPSTDNLSGTYQLLAEASGGVGSVTYSVGAIAWVNRRSWNGAMGLGSGQYYFQPQQVTLRPASEQPDGVTLEFAERVGVVRIHFGTDSTCSTPASINTSSVWTSRGFTHLNAPFRPGYSMGYYLMPGGERLTATISTKIGTSDAVDMITFRNTVEFNAGPDEIQDVCIPIPDTATALGAISTPIQIFGHTLVPRTSYMAATDGPHGNWRFTFLNGSAPESQSSTWPLLPNMVPGDYSLWSEGLLDMGDQQVRFRTNLGAPPHSPRTTVLAGQTVDAKQTFANGERYPFISHPAHFNGSVRLYDRYVESHPHAPSSLNSLSFHTQWPIDHPDYPGGTVRGPTGGTALQASSSYGLSYTSFSGRFEATTGDLDSTYSLPVVAIYDQPELWAFPSLRLRYASESHTIVSGQIQAINHDYDLHIYYAHPEMASPSSYRLGWMTLSPTRPLILVHPGGSYVQDQHYCFNEVRVQYSSLRGAFVNPIAYVTGGFDGADFEGNASRYTGEGIFYGTPAVGYYQPSETFRLARATTGLLAFALPQGTWRLSPGATFVNDDGSSSSGNFPSTQLTVGCGQRVALTPGLSISIQAEATCQSGKTATIAGRVESGGVEVDHIWYDLNGKTYDICTSACPNSFTFDVPLEGSGGALTVYASSSFIKGTASVSDTLPECRPPNVPPVLPPLQDLVVEAQGPEGSAVEFPLPIANDREDGPISTTCSTAPGAIFGLGQTQVTCTATDSGGLTTQQSFTVTVRDTLPPVITTPGAIVHSACDRVVHYTVTAWDRVSQSVTPLCSPASGSVFPLGESVVTCIATDAAGNSSTASFAVHVNFDAAFSGFLSPLAWQRIAPKEQASPTGLPVKFRLNCDERPSIQPRLLWAPGSGAEAVNFQPASAKGNANTGNLFRATNEGWIFNLDVRLLGTGPRTLRVELGDERFHDVAIIVGSNP